MVMPLGDNAPTRITPWVTYGLIVANVIVYLIQMSSPEIFTTSYAATPYEITHNVDLADVYPLDQPKDAGPLAPVGDREGEIRAIRHEAIPIPVYLTLLTSMFMHGSPLHLAGNMLYLWIFGDNVEEVLGHLRYLVVYVVCGLAGSLSQIIAAPNSMIPTLGASAAIAGMMGAYVVWFPRNQVRVLLFRMITEVPALIVIGFWILTQIFSGIGSFASMGKSGGVAYLAHVGGAAAGIAFAFLFQGRARENAGVVTEINLGRRRSGGYDPYGDRRRPW